MYDNSWMSGVVLDNRGLYKKVTHAYDLHTVSQIMEYINVVLFRQQECPKTMFTCAILYPLLPFLQSSDYASLLCSCTEIRRNYDETFEWRRRSPEVQMHHKLHSLLKDMVQRYNPLQIMYEIKSKSRMNILLYCYRHLYSTSVLFELYQRYLDSKSPLFRLRIRMEKARLYTLGDSSHFGKRKRSSGTALDCTQAPKKQLLLGI